MCRSIKVLRRADSQPSEQEIHEAALQFVRKISGYRVPSQANTVVFEAAVRDVTASSQRLLEELTTRPGGAARSSSPSPGRSARATTTRPSARRARG
ncbi:MAG TPA: DUF2277 domain-containing protein [Candidatus Dormibacteraeota bacterium]|nr:DUF2277 domain-containing protein [Candidatus Dormibacteraeota bacterium]